MWQGDFTFELSWRAGWGGRSCRHAGSWSYLQGSTRNRENEGKTYNLGWMLYSVYAVLGVGCTRCMLYSVYAVLGVCCTRCMLYSVYAALGVNSWSWHGEIARDDLTLCSVMMVEKERWGMKMRTIWRIRADMRCQGYDLPDWVWKTSHRCFYPPDRE